MKIFTAILIVLLSNSFESFGQELRFATVSSQSFVQASTDSTGWYAVDKAYEFNSELIILEDRSAIVHITEDSTSIYLVQGISYNQLDDITTYQVQSNTGKYYHFNYDKPKNLFAVTYENSDNQISMNYIGLGRNE